MWRGSDCRHPIARTSCAPASAHMQTGAPWPWKLRGPTRCRLAGVPRRHEFAEKLDRHMADSNEESCE